MLEATDTVSISFCLHGSDSQGLKMKLQSEEKSGHWDAKYAFIFLPPPSLSVRSAVTTLSHTAWATGGEAAQREGEICYSYRMTVIEM